MTNNQDARPFVELEKDAEEFRSKFDEDIKECINFLDSQITSLICDPDSRSASTTYVKQNALIEFSKAKYDIFIKVKSLMNRKEREWINYISEMKKLFIENVEIFLAGTKLEVKLPSSEFEPSPGPRKSPGNRKSMSMTSSIYPVLRNVAKSIPVLGSTLQTKEDAKVEEDVQFNRGSRYSTKLYKSSGGIASSIKKDTTSSDSSDSEVRQDDFASFLTRNMGDSDISESEARTKRNAKSTIKGRLSATAVKLANSFRDEVNEIMDTDEAEFGVEDVPVKKSTRGRKSVVPVAESYKTVPSHSKSYLTSSDEHVQPELSNVFTPVKASGRRKTLLPSLEATPVSEIIPGNPTRSSSKRKTFGGVAELESATSSKRLRVGSGKSIPSVQEEEEAEADDNLLESDGYFSEWMPLRSLDGKIPTEAAVYEVKLGRAKKTAYIGSAENLRSKLTLHKLRQNSGNKHFDKYLDKNYDDIQIRYLAVPSIDSAKLVEKNRIKNFVAQYKTTPAYNK